MSHGHMTTSTRLLTRRGFLTVFHTEDYVNHLTYFMIYLLRVAMKAENGSCETSAGGFGRCILRQ